MLLNYCEMYLCTIMFSSLVVFSMFIKVHLKVRLRWFGAVLQHTCKLVFFLTSFNVSIGIIYHWIARDECYMMI